MTKDELRQILEQERFNPLVYSLDGGLPDNALCLESKGDGWHVYYSERGSKWDERIFASEADACADLLHQLRKLPHRQTHF